MFSPEKYVCWQALQQGITLMPLENVQGGDMPGDTAHISTPVCRRVEKLLPHLVTKLEEKYGTDIPAKLVIAVSGGSGSGKTSGAAALREALAMVGLKGYVLSGDNYPRRIPQHNDEERLTIFRSAGLKALLAAGEYTPERFADLQPLQKTGIDSDPRQCAAYPWMQIYQQGGRAALAGYLGRTAEQDYDALNAVLAQFRAGAPVLWLKRMGRKEWERWYEPKNFADVDVLLLEWTHAGSALRHCLQPGNTLRNASPTCSRCRKPESTVIRANVRHTHGCKSTNREGGPRWRDIWAGLPSRTTTH